MISMLEYKGYRASVTYDADDGIFVGEVSDIADSLNFHGHSLDELEQMFHQSIDNYRELCGKIGKSPDRAFAGSFSPVFADAKGAVWSAGNMLAGSVK